MQLASGVQPLWGAVLVRGSSCCPLGLPSGRSLHLMLAHNAGAPLAWRSHVMLAYLKHVWQSSQAGRQAALAKWVM